MLEKRQKISWFQRLAAMLLGIFVLSALPGMLVHAATEQTTASSQLTSTGQKKASAKKYNNYEEVARDMHELFTAAREAISKDDKQAAYDAVNSAYFDYYEIHGFEKNVMVALSRTRVGEIEALFRDIKMSLAGSREFNAEAVQEQIKLLDTKVYRDGMVLSGMAPTDSPDSVGAVILGDEAPAADQAANQQSQKSPAASAGSGKVPAADPAFIRNVSFFTSFGLMLREGLEAILVCVAIISYLVKTGNKHLCKGVYIGMLAALVCSVFLAILIEQLFGGVGQELIEGWTMFLAVAVLFWVSNWMLSKSEHEAWDAYIHKQVQNSVDRRSYRGLVLAAFLAVIREGAELILFYKAAVTGGISDTTYSALGFAAAVAILLAVFLIFRFTSVKLPLKPFFYATSILLYLLCISFMGKGVVELTEANVILGGTEIPALSWINVPELNIYNRAETLIPQLMLLIASLWILLSNWARGRRQRKELNKKNAEALQA